MFRLFLEKKPPGQNPEGLNVIDINNNYKDRSVSVRQFGIQAVQRF
jgi:hypothetical protein